VAVVISAMGGFVPPMVVDNARIAKWTGRSAAWIKERTGIQERRYAPADVPTSGLAHSAVNDMTKRFPGALNGVSTIIFATSTPDRPQPPTATILQGMIGLSGVPAFDVNAVCAGWLFGLRIAAAFAYTQPGKVLLIAADKYSPILDRDDPTTVSLFGDGAGAAVIEFGGEPGSGLRSLVLASNGEHADLVTVLAGGSELPASDNPKDYLFRMRGREVKSFVLDRLPSLLRYACSEADVRLSDLGAIICHQANVRLLELVAKELGVDASLMPLTAPQYGNTGAASLPLTLLAAHDAGLLVQGRPVALCAVGGGMSIGAGVYVP
jgi:3-oxoacyl-(acyl-carrier-protein) synthase III